MDSPVIAFTDDFSDALGCFPAIERVRLQARHQFVAADDFTSRPIRLSLAFVGSKVIPVAPSVYNGEHRHLQFQVWLCLDVQGADGDQRYLQSHS